jgi:ribonuclease P protein component
MQRRLRLTSSKRFSRLHREGRSLANNLLVIRVVPNGSDETRFGFIVNRRIGNSVTRNRVKRRLREAARGSPVRPGWDVAFIARRGSEKAKYQQLKNATDNLLKRSQLLAPPNAGDLLQ